MILIVAWVTRKPVEVATFAVMLVVQFVFVVGYRRSEGGQSDMLPLATAIWAAAPDAQTINGLDTNVRPGVDLSIYLNRTTPWMPPDQWRKLSRGDRPRVVILLQEDKEPPPHVPAGWSSLASIPYGRERWWALLLPRA